MQNPLSASYYTDPGYFDLDKEKILYSSWQCVCHVSELDQVGQYMTHRIVDEDIFIIRDKDEILRGFYNVCRHRGHPLVEGKGKIKNLLVCPYHAWSYHTNGHLQRAPGSLPTDGIDCSNIKLREVQVETFCGFVFVNLDESASSLESSIGDLEQVIRSYHPEPEKLRFICETTIEHDCNWKLSVENYNECYHCPTVHRSSLTKGVLSMQGYTTVPHGTMIWHEGKAQTTNEKQYNYDTSHGPRAGDYGAYWIWPNVAFCCYPGGYFTIRQWLPINWRKTVYLYRWFTDGSIPDADVKALMLKHKQTTGAEDEQVVSRIQKGMESRAFEPGPYVIGDGCGAMSEVGLKHFHQLYRQALGLTVNYDEC